jgi:hypothetical protein
VKTGTATNFLTLIRLEIATQGESCRLLGGGTKDPISGAKNILYHPAQEVRKDDKIGFLNKEIEAYRYLVWQQQLRLF